MSLADHTACEVFILLVSGLFFPGSVNAPFIPYLVHWVHFVIFVCFWSHDNFSKYSEIIILLCFSIHFPSNTLWIIFLDLFYFYNLNVFLILFFLRTSYMRTNFISLSLPYPILSLLHLSLPPKSRTSSSLLFTQTHTYTYKYMHTHVHIHTNIHKQTQNFGFEPLEKFLSCRNFYFKSSFIYLFR